MSPSFPRAFVSSRFSALRHRNFRLYFTCQLISLVGTWMQSVAQSWLLHRLDPAPLALGLLSFIQFLPVLLLSVWAGVLADRVDKRRMLLVTQSVALVQALTIAAVVTMGVVQPWMIYSLALVYGVFNACDLPARQSFLVEIAGKEDLSNAIALNSAAFNAARIVGPAIAGLLVASLPLWITAAGIRGWFHTPLVGEAGCFWINALSYVAMLFGLSRMNSVARAPSSSGAGALTYLKEGVRYASRPGAIRNLLVLLAFMSSLGFQYLTLLPVYTKEILHSGADTYGLLVSAFGVGSLVAAGVLTRRQERDDLRRNLFLGLLSAGLALAVFAWSRSLPLSLAMGFVAGFGLILYVASTNTMLQLSVEDRFRGRVMSLYTLALVGVAPIGALVSGFIAQRANAPVATSFSAVMLLCGALWVSYRLRAIAAERAAREAREAAAEPAEPVG
jgi:MFS family permease